MSYSVEICNCITRFLDSDDWKYQVNQEKGVIKLGLNIRNKLKHVNIAFDLRDDKYLLYFTCPSRVAEAQRAEIRDLLNRINYSLMFGCFEMDERDGEIRFRYPVDCDHQLPSREVISHSLYRSGWTVTKYGDAIVQVQTGLATGKDAFDAVPID